MTSEETPDVPQESATPDASPAELTALDVSPTVDAATDETPADGTATDELPTDELPTDGTPTDVTPADENLSDENLSDENPADGTAADDGPEPPVRVFALPAAPDTVCADAIDQAREAALAVGGGSVGEHVGVRAEAERVVTHAFRAGLPGYVGWFWAVTVARASRSRAVTVDEVVLLPGDGALLAPGWIPWNERVRPGDLSPGDLLPTTEDDIRLVPAYTLSDDPQVERVGFELGLGRERVMSRDGRELAAERWATGDRGPDAPMARQAPGHCGTCGFMLALAGSLSAGFGVCGNDLTDTDGQVVSVEYGCGAHSQVRAESTALAEIADVVWDDGEEITAGR